MKDLNDKDLLDGTFKLIAELKSYATTEFNTWNLRAEKLNTVSSNFDLDKSEKDLLIAKELYITDTITLYVTRILFGKLLNKFDYISNYDDDYNIFFRKEDINESLNQINPNLYNLIIKQLNDLNSIEFSDFERYVFDREYFPRNIRCSMEILIDVPIGLFDQESLGDLYQNLLNIDKRKHFGEFYTPESIVNYILKETILKEENSDSGKILDSSCGFGTFLLESIKALRLDGKRFSYSDIFGFDVNNFAVILTKFQLFWDLIINESSKDEIPEKFNIFHLDSLERGSKDLNIFTYEQSENNPEYNLRDSEKYNYIIGNPPYIRAERLKNGKSLKEEWGNLWGQNADTALIFLYRSLMEWTQENGMIGLVVSGGYANSKAAQQIREIISEKVTLKQVVWLEFANKVWDANAIPMILIIENRVPKGNDIIKIASPSSWPEEDIVFQEFTYSDFFSNEINPNKKLLPLITNNDLEILSKTSGFPKLGDIMQFKYGIQRGTKSRITQEPTGPNSVKVIDGKSLFVGGMGEYVGWVDLDHVQKKSLWNGEDITEGFIALPGITLAPSAVFVSNTDIAALDTSIVGRINDVKKMKAITSYLNSNIVRFITLVQLRSGVMEGSRRLHVYPRTVAQLPVNLNDKVVAVLSNLYTELASAAEDNNKSQLFKVINKIDQVVGEMLGLNSNEISHIKERLLQNPLKDLVPRYSRSNLNKKIPKGYKSDRYSFQKG